MRKYYLTLLIFLSFTSQIFPQGWFQQSVGTNFSFFSIHFTDNSTGWVVGRAGTILNTIDGGTNWNSQTSGTTELLTSVHFTDNNTGWTVGDYGTILKTINGGISFVEEDKIDEMPATYLLSQNYPNPFNPSTTIKYQIPELSFVTLKVYDVLGNEVAILVNGEKPPGEYEIGFSTKGGSSGGGDVYNLPSGVYFYRLQAGDFVETKKMILLK